MKMNPGASNLCGVCNKSNARLCNRCKSARYCSAACQQDDWRTHKLLCANFSNFNASSRPTIDHFRAILFTVDDKQPKLIWLHCTWRKDDTGGRYQHPDHEALLGHDTMIRDIPIQYNSVLKRNLPNTIYISHRDTFLVDGSKPNKSVAAITGTISGQYHDWRGSMIAYGKVGPGINQKACKDLDMNDFRHITDYFLSYDYNLEHSYDYNLEQLATQQPTDIKVKGVRINCIGDQKMLSKPHFETVEVSSTDPIFYEHDTSDIAKRIGLPIFTRRCPPNPRWENENDWKIFNGESPFNNQDATFLHLCCDPKAERDGPTGIRSWGWASLQWQSSVGSAIVVRQDKKPLSPLHVEALCIYCRREIRPLLAHTMGEYAPEEPMSKAHVLTMICRPTFVIYWYKLLDEKTKDGEDTSAPYPYDDDAS